MKVRERTLKEPPSPTMIAMLESVKDHGDPFHHLNGRSERGGAEGTLGAVKRRGWLECDRDRQTWVITLAGIDVLERHWHREAA